MALTDDIKKFCGIADYNDSKDSVIQIHIDTAMADLIREGIRKEIVVAYTDPLIVTAITTYAAGMLNVEGRGQQFLALYRELRDTLALTQEYISEASDV